MRPEIRSVANQVIAHFVSRKVLIVDENVEDLAQHASHFEARGFEVHKCTSYETALRSIEREDFDLALVDQGSPAFEGRLVVKHLIRYNPGTPFIVLARPKDMACSLQAVLLGAVDYLEKPISTAEMNRVIQANLGTRL